MSDQVGLITTITARIAGLECHKLGTEGVDEWGNLAPFTDHLVASTPDLMPALPLQLQLSAQATLQRRSRRRQLVVRQAMTTAPRLEALEAEVDALHKWVARRKLPDSPGAFRMALGPLSRSSKLSRA